VIVMDYKLVVEDEVSNDGVMFYDFRVEDGEGDVVFSRDGYNMTYHQAKRRDVRLVSIAMMYLEREGFENYAESTSSNQLIEDEVFEVVEE